MDVKSVSQGGQATFEMKTQTNKTSETYQVTAVKASDENKTNNGNEALNINTDEVKKAVAELNKILVNDNTFAEYEVNKAFGDLIITIKDSTTKEVIQEIPSRKMIEYIENICNLAGILVDKKA